MKKRFLFITVLTLCILLGMSVVNAAGTKLNKPVVTTSNVASTGKVKLTWNAVDGAVKYRVYCATESNGTYKLLKTVTATNHIHAYGQAGVKYYYRVQAVAASAANNSDRSAVKARTCDLPRPTITATNVESSGKVRLTWDAVDGAVKYQIYRSTEPNGTYPLVYTVTGTKYTHTSGEAGVKYYYKVRAVASNTNANSACSPVKARTCDLARPDVSIARNNNGKPKLTWNAVPGAVKYQVYRADSKSGTYSLKYTTAKTSYTNTGAVNGNTYYYKVKAIHSVSAANSAFSAVDSIEAGLPVASSYSQQVVDRAMYIYRNWDTVYAHGQSNGIQNADGTYGFDCSGFVSYVLNTVMQQHVPTYRVTANLQGLYDLDVIYNEGYPGEFSAGDVPMSDLQPGDVLFFNLRGSLGHCGIYIGDNQFVHSTSSQNGVCVMSLTGSYAERFIGARRYVPNRIVPANTVRYINTQCKLYAERTSDSNVLLVNPKGSAVTVLYTKTDNMAYVETANGTRGFVWLKYLSK